MGLRKGCEAVFVRHLRTSVTCPGSIYFPMKVLLCSPNNVVEGTRRGESLGIGYLGALASAHGFDVLVRDAHCAKEPTDRTIDFIVAAKPDVLGLQIIFHEQLEPARAIAEATRCACPNCLIVAGGHVPTHTAETVLERIPQLLCVFRGEAELSFLAFLQALKKKGSAQIDIRAIPGIAANLMGRHYQTKTLPLVSDLDALPFPLRDSTHLEKSRHASIIGSRGCYCTCSFCSTPEFFGTSAGPRWRLRSAENVFEEIRQLATHHGVTHLSFVDDIFMARDRASRQRALKLADMIKKSRLEIKFAIECRPDVLDRHVLGCLKQAGLSRVLLGVEAGDDKSLHDFGKGTTIRTNAEAISILRSMGFSIGIGFMLFHPQSTLQSIREGIAFLRNTEMANAYTLTSKMQVRPGTRIWKEMLKADRLDGDILAPDYSFLDGRVTNLYKLMSSIFQTGKRADNEIARLDFTRSVIHVNELQQLEFQDLLHAYSSEMAGLAEAAFSSIVNREEEHVHFELCREAEKIISKYAECAHSLIPNAAPLSSKAANS